MIDLDARLKKFWNKHKNADTDDDWKALVTDLCELERDLSEFGSPEIMDRILKGIEMIEDRYYKRHPEYMK